MKAILLARASAAALCGASLFGASQAFAQTANYDPVVSSPYGRNFKISLTKKF